MRKIEKQLNIAVENWHPFKSKNTKFVISKLDLSIGAVFLWDTPIVLFKLHKSELYPFLAQDGGWMSTTTFSRLRALGISIGKGENGFLEYTCPYTRNLGKPFNGVVNGISHSFNDPESGRNWLMRDHFSLYAFPYDYRVTTEGTADVSIRNPSTVDTSHIIDSSATVRHINYLANQVTQTTSSSPWRFLEHFQLNVPLEMTQVQVTISDSTTSESIND